MKNYFVIIIGDTIALLVTTLIGFITHGEGNLSFLLRFLAAFIPLVFAWLLLAPWFGLFQAGNISDPKKIWRVPLAMILIAPLAVTMRSALLSTDVQPIFVYVFGVTSGFGLLVWRGLYLLFKPKP